MAIIKGTSGNDELHGTNEDDAIEGFQGNDLIYGFDGDDILTSADGNDVVFGGEGDDLLISLSGNDYLDGGAGADRMTGGEGNDTYVVDHVGDVTGEVLFGGGVDHVLSTASHTLGFGIEHLELQGSAAINGTGNEKDNSLIGNSANNVLSGLNGDDTLNGGAGNDTLNGGIGFDTMDGGAGNDTYVVDSPLDVVIDRGSTSDIDTVQSSINHTLNGTIERLILTGTAVIIGSGNAQNNVLTGNGANNLLFGELGDDQLNGGAGNDTLLGGFGNDLLNGGTGADTMNGGFGNDTLRGGTGKDELTGGDGADRFDYNAVSESPAGTGRDRIVDFTGNGAGVGDRIDLTTIDANGLVAGNQAFIFGGPHTAGHLWYAGGILNGNIDGDATPEFQIQLVGTPALVVGGASTDILL
jgi:Ca2+-binding RTX toxin-like protein